MILKIQKDIVFELCFFEVSDTYTTDNNVDLIDVSYEVFKNVADSYTAPRKETNEPGSGILSWIYIENNNIVKIEHQYRP